MRDLHVNGFPPLNPPTNCAHCGRPFPDKDGEFTAWRGSNGQFYCNDFCEDGDAEKIYLEERRATRTH